jgi:hypothetical protein
LIRHSIQLFFGEKRSRFLNSEKLNNVVPSLKVITDGFVSDEANRLFYEKLLPFPQGFVQKSHPARTNSLFDTDPEATLHRRPSLT